MKELTLLFIIVAVLSAILFTMVDATVLIGVGTIVWIGLGAFFAGIGWTLLFLAGLVGNGVQRFRR